MSGIIIALIMALSVPLAVAAIIGLFLLPRLIKKVRKRGQEERDTTTDTDADTIIREVFSDEGKPTLTDRVDDVLTAIFSVVRDIIFYAVVGAIIFAAAAIGWNLATNGKSIKEYVPFKEYFFDEYSPIKKEIMKRNRAVSGQVFRFRSPEGTWTLSFPKDKEGEELWLTFKPASRLAPRVTAVFQQGKRWRPPSYRGPKSWILTCPQGGTWGWYLDPRYPEKRTIHIACDDGRTWNVHL